ncbi:bifunctional enoyl-CoA hydratase/phosphate acetyltransferase [Pacificimonas sp. WHA3]|uniref:Bifunctional enoyl-CoA hydratase/phosphate acetyltransferase n=1 Tax=Pacificimonas pallii TaxID=2827236 RepID=A0ABS6SE03_9SPHN|nr:bifunctional enoyl-CoA hydratase/phosphate acetyltransferase [Pacificimonas pallii]MBV7256609.1 bifunctional enoyl-CoA hydratase/phosphate acetyltransferase [Pacificimonas pallii]
MNSSAPVHPHHDLAAALIERARAGRAPLRTAVVHPVDAASLGGAIAAADAGLIRPVLIGPKARIESAGRVSGHDMIDVPHSHAAAAKAAALAGAGDVDAIMKGALHTDELLAAILDRKAGLRTARRVSHVFVLDVPDLNRPLFISDAAINIAPDLAAKRDIVQNAIDLACALGIKEPKVAILAATEEVVPSMCATLDAAALCKMADRGQITGGILDGPLAFDNAMSPEALTAKGMTSPVAGAADILIVPDIEAGNIMAKQLDYLSGADAFGIALGAKVPIILTSRADSIGERLVSAALAKLAAQAQ